MMRFRDRTDAGQQLAQKLGQYQSQKDTLILALPRGGVPIAYELTTALNLPMSIFLVRKLGVPWHEELAMGALAEKDICILNKSLITQLGITEAQIQTILEKEQKELVRRLQCYRQGRPLPNLQDKTVILVDDGIATGASLKTAIRSIETFQPKNIVLAVPVASRDSIQELTPHVSKFICLITPEVFSGVGEYYEKFEQMTDEEVLNILSRLQNI